MPESEVENNVLAALVNIEDLTAKVSTAEQVTTVGALLTLRKLHLMCYGESESYLPGPGLSPFAALHSLSELDISCDSGWDASRIVSRITTQPQLYFSDTLRVLHLQSLPNLDDLSPLGVL